MGNEAQAHWDDVYGTKPLTEVSWYQSVPTTSLRLIGSVATATQAVVDVGAGASFLAGELIARGYQDVTVLDVSGEALAAMRSRLAHTSALHFVVSDLLSWTPPRQYDVWHDRAVLHFLTADSAATTYASLAAEAVRSGGALVVGTFASDGPTACSGLVTARYDADALAARFAQHFSETHREREEHVTPSGVIQPFTWLVLRRK